MLPQWGLNMVPIVRGMSTRVVTTWKFRKAASPRPHVDQRAREVVKSAKVHAPGKRRQDADAQTDGRPPLDEVVGDGVDLSAERHNPNPSPTEALRLPQGRRPPLPRRRPVTGGTAALPRD